MQRPHLQRLVMLCVAGLALSGASVSIHAVTADNVVCNGCVQSSDIADNTINTADIQNSTISSADMNPVITLGTNTVGGVFRIRTVNNPAAYVLEANMISGGQRLVRIGQGGAPATNEDTNLQVIDPFYAGSAIEPVMEMDAASGSLYLGSGNSTTTGQSGELFIENGAGRINVWLYGFGSAYLGNTGSAGYLALDDGTTTWTSVQVVGSNGNVVNQFNGSGLVKAWARINADGTVASCYRCDPAETQLIPSFTGQYEVDFTPVGTDVSGRPWTCSLGTGAVFGASGEISCVQRTGDPSSVFVAIKSSSGSYVNQAYTVVVY